MIKTKGYFLLHRSIWSNPTIMKDVEHLVVWIYILSQVEWEDGRVVDFGGKKITLKAGQMTIGVSNQMYSDLKHILPHLTKDKLFRILKCYSDAKQIAKQRSARCSLITVLNWDKYQKNAKQITEQLRTNEINKESSPTKSGEQSKSVSVIEDEGWISSDELMEWFKEHKNDESD